MESEQPKPPPPHQAPIFVPPGQAPPPGYTAHYPVQPQGPLPTNGYAMAGLIVSGSSLAFLFLSAGILAPATLFISIIGTVLGHKGKTDVDQGKAAQQRDIGVAGFWTGIAGIILSVLALAAWAALLIFMISLDEASSSFDWHDEFMTPDGQDWRR
ncbi:MAG: hypothetical protein JHD02_08010 [Thermoleophilaceae bacterium]|nr:hypothetical protein [Thermoleophilaceae bacterium]